VTEGHRKQVCEALVIWGHDKLIILRAPAKTNCRGFYSNTWPAAR